MKSAFDKTPTRPVSRAAGPAAGAPGLSDAGLIPELGAQEFDQLCAIVREQSGIVLQAGKEALVRARLGRRLRQLELDNYPDYLAHLRANPAEEMVALLDAISTNVTQFFREIEHFVFLAQTALPALMDAKARDREPRRLRLWSAGCSSGEEPYTLAIVLSEHVPAAERWDVKILATDLSTKVLNLAREGVYETEKLTEIQPDLLRRHFLRAPDRGERSAYQVNETLRGLVRFARLNLMGAWPMKGPFDVIFCRNVMIYFDRETRQKLIQRYYDLLAPGGYLFIGHSESLTGIQNAFKYLGPTIYQKG